MSLEQRVQRANHAKDIVGRGPKSTCLFQQASTQRKPINNDLEWASVLRAARKGEGEPCTWAQQVTETEDYLCFIASQGTAYLLRKLLACWICVLCWFECMCMSGCIMHVMMNGKLQSDIITIQWDIITIQWDMITIQWDIITIQLDIIAIQLDDDTIHLDVVSLHNKYSTQ